MRISDWSSDVCASDLWSSPWSPSSAACSASTAAAREPASWSSFLAIRKLSLAVFGPGGELSSPLQGGGGPMVAAVRPFLMFQGDAEAGGSEAAIGRLASALSDGGTVPQIGRASCRARVCQYV